MLDCLKIYNALAFPLFPCHAHGEKAKAPLTEHGFLEASLDWQKIEAWYHQFPGCAWAVPTSAERAVLDVDPRHNGHIHLAKLEAEHGLIPPTPKAKTGGDGNHQWLCCPPGTHCRSIAKSDFNPRADSITLKADGGYVIVPPSRIAIPEHEGRAYTWEVRPWEMPIAKAPDWLFSMKPKASATGFVANDPWIVQEACADLLTHPGCDKSKGEHRPPVLCQLVGVHLARGDSPASIYAMAEAWAKRCNPPLDDWQKHVDGLIAKEEAKAGRMTPTKRESTIGVLPEPGRKQINSDAEAQGEGEGEGEGELVSFPAFASQQSEAQGELVCFLPAPAQTVKPVVPVIQEHEPDAFPQLPPEAYHGLFGEMLRAIEPHTEADPSGILLGWLTCFGNVVGRGAWFKVGPRLHHPALYVGIVGRTSDAKGDSWAVSLYPFRMIEPEWASICIANGVGSGEGLIERIADEQIVMGKDGEAKTIPGAEDKRCLLRLSELSQCFKRGRRENATLSEHLRETWDGEPIHVPNRKGNALSASEYTVSLMSDITPGVIRKSLESGTEAFDGWANRFLWAAVKRSRFLPSGGSMDGLKPYLDRLAMAVAFAKSAGELNRDADADALWNEVYPTLSTSGDEVPHTDRARPYVVRLSMLYALADGSTAIKREHLAASLAVWEYCRQSARLIFGSRETTEPEPLWLRLSNAISKAPGISRTGLREVIGSKVRAEEIDAALAHLKRSGLAYKRMVQAEGGGRPAECWYPGREPDGDKPVNDTDKAFSPWIVQPEADAESMGRKQTNSADAQAELVSFPPEREANSDGELVCFLPAQSKSRILKNLPPMMKPFPRRGGIPSPGFCAMPPQTIEALTGVIREWGLRFRWAWREDLGSGKSDDRSCVVIVENAPEFDALCMQYQDHLQMVVPFDNDECLRSAFGID